MFRALTFMLGAVALVTALSATSADAPASRSIKPLPSPSHNDHVTDGAAHSPLRSQLQRVAPDLSPEVLAFALKASDCATMTGAIPGGGVSATRRLGVIDYSKPSTERRLWVFDLQQARLLHHEHVAHGRGSGENFASAFSNRESSHQSSLGLFTTGETYIGGNGYSLRMDGLEPGINDKARHRAIVMHGAAYVDPVQALRQGRLGRSFGCPALRPAVANAVIDTLKQGQLIFAYYPDRAWLSGSRFLDCKGRAGAFGQNTVR